MGPTLIPIAPGLRAECIDPYEIWRATTLLTKEEGTIRWLRTIKPGEVVYDIGANIGLYTLVAAAKGAQVYAFEPHVGNAARLLRNLALNQMTGQVQVITSALHEMDGFLPFNYFKHNPGSSGSQLGNTTLETGDQFTPVATELKYAVTVDRLIDDGLITPANLIKIDVDGLELPILRGMRKLLQGPWIRSVQVEMHPTTDTEIVREMATHDFTIAERHHTSNGKGAIARGADPLMVPHNAVFERIV